MTMEQETKFNNNSSKNASLLDITTRDEHIVQCVNDKEVCCCEATSRGLHQFHCIPHHLAFNNYILSGYRVDLTTWQCVKSILYLHNETFNIYSHGIPCLLFIIAAPYVFRVEEAHSFDSFLYSLHYIAAILCCGLSTVYHIGKCHEGGRDTYHRLLTFDLLGIWFATSFSNIAFLKATFYCLYWPNKLIIPLYSMVTVICIAWLIKGRDFPEKLRPLAFLFLFRIPFYLSRYLLNINGYITAPVNTTWIFLISEFSGFLGSVVSFTRFPERWYPGKLDYLGNSHNILHVLAITCPLACHFGSLMDFRWLTDTTCKL